MHTERGAPQSQADDAWTLGESTCAGAVPRQHDWEANRATPAVAQGAASCKRKAGRRDAARMDSPAMPPPSMLAPDADGSDRELRWKRSLAVAGVASVASRAGQISLDAFSRRALEHSRRLNICDAFSIGEHSGYLQHMQHQRASMRRQSRGGVSGATRYAAASSATSVWWMRLAFWMPILSLRAR